MNTQKIKDNTKGFLKKHEDKIVQGCVNALGIGFVYACGMCIYKLGFKDGNNYGVVNTVLQLRNKEE